MSERWTKEDDRELLKSLMKEQGITQLSDLNSPDFRKLRRATRPEADGAEMAGCLIAVAVVFVLFIIFILAIAS